MQEFYKKTLLALILLLVADALVAAFCIYQSYLSSSVLAAHPGGLRWHYVGNTDAERGGTSTIRIRDPDGERLRFDFRVAQAGLYPFAAAELVLYDGKERLVQIDWSKYGTMTFLAKCAPANSILMGILTFDDQISRVGEFPTYRTPQTFFSCSEKGVPVSLDMTRFTIPEWWLGEQKLAASHHNDYTLDKVSKLSFGSSFQSPRNVDSWVEISELALHGRDYRYIYALAAIFLAGWSAFGICFFRAHTRALIASLNSKLKKDLTLVAYRQLTLEPYKDKEKASILRFMATNYTDTNLDMDGVVSAAGVNRAQVNEVLKTELGLTFTSYLNKLRLTEAARLLAEASGAAIAEIAYSVGYGNVSYFNRLFKEEYGCTPKAFRSLATRQQRPAECAPPEPGSSADTAH